MLDSCNNLPIFSGCTNHYTKRSLNFKKYILNNHTKIITMYQEILNTYFKNYLKSKRKTPKPSINTIAIIATVLTGNPPVLASGEGVIDCSKIGEASSPLTSPTCSPIPTFPCSDVTPKTPASKPVAGPVETNPPPGVTAISFEYSPPLQPFPA